MMCKYKCFYESRTTELEAETSYEAYTKAIAHFKPRKSQQHMVHVHLIEKDGKPITHTPSF